MLAPGKSRDFGKHRIDEFWLTRSRFPPLHSFLKLRGVKALLITAALCKSPLLRKGQGSLKDSNGSSAQPTVHTPPCFSSIFSCILVSDPAKDLRGHVSVALRKLHEATEVEGRPNEDLLKDCIAQIQ